MLKKIKEKLPLIKKRILSVLLFGRLWLTLFFSIVFIILSSKYFIYKEIISGITFYKINFCILIIITCLTGLFFYKIFSYLCDLKTKNNKSISDIIFVCLFFIMLLIPSSHINNEKISDFENRALAQYKSFLINEQINYNFGKNFEKWFNDRFFTRNLLINLHKIILISTNRVYNDNKVIFDKKDGWFFFQREIKGTYRIPKSDELLFVKNNLNQLADFCAQNGIKMYFVLAPDKSNIYRELVPLQKLENKKTYGQTLIKYFDTCNDIRFGYIYPEQEVNEAKEKYNKRIFFQTDNHQTDISGYIVYKATIKKIKQDFNDIPIVSLDEFYVKKNNLVNISEEDEDDFTLGNANEYTVEDPKYLTYEYEYYYPKNKKSIQYGVYDDPYLLKSKSYNTKGKRKAILLGSSFVEKVYIFLRHSFKLTDKIRLNTGYEKNFHMNRFENYIKNEKPDILIIYINESEAYNYISSMYDESVELEP